MLKLPTAMPYDLENRLANHHQMGSVVTFLYSADNLKRVKNIDGAVTTLVWDGRSYLEERF
ncbi:MAG: hypothetical protein ACYC96_16310 [Fimbriimonadaceae bacterium]